MRLATLLRARPYQRLGWIVCLVFCLILSALLIVNGWVTPAWAGPKAATKPALTPALLAQRLAQPVKRDGQLTVDLQNVQIDLRDDDFRAAFYSQTQSALQTGTAPLSLDLGSSVIQGELDLSQLGLRTPLLGDGLRGLLPEAARQQVDQDRNRVDANRTTLSVFRGRLSLAETAVTGPVVARNTYFLNEVEAQDSRISGPLLAQQSRFLKGIDAANAQFQQGGNFSQAVFFGRAIFNQAVFSGETDFSRAEFQDEGRFIQATFQSAAAFSRSYWQGTASFDQSRFEQALTLSRTQFSSALTLSEAVLIGPLSLRQAQFGQAVNLRGATIQQQADFGDAQFAVDAIINVPDLAFDAQSAHIFGTPDQLGQQFSVPALTGNEAVLKRLIRNFRQLEQIADANQVQFTLQQLRLRQLAQRLRAVDLNRASFLQLSRLGLTVEQTQAIVDYRDNTPFVRPADLLKLPEIGAADYWQVSDRVVTDTTPSRLQRVGLVLRWLGLELLLILSRYGTSFSLVFGVGWVIIAPFALTYWWADRDRAAPLSLTELLPSLLTYLSLITTGIVLIYRSSPTPGATLMGLTLLVVPPLGLFAVRLPKPPPNAPSYFTQDGSERQLRLLIARLPVMPEYYFFRNRYTGLVRSRRWNWLNYFDFSVNNSLRFGFNDTRLRDLSVPGALSWLAWYQWTLGVLYIALLLWTLSRTIPGLNLLLYF